MIFEKKIETNLLYDFRAKKEIRQNLVFRFILLLYFLKYYGSIHWQLAYKNSDHLEQNWALKSNLNFKFRPACFCHNLSPFYSSSFSIFFCLDCLKFWPKVKVFARLRFFLDISHSLYYILVARNSKCILGRPAKEKKLANFRKSRWFYTSIGQN